MVLNIFLASVVLALTGCAGLSTGSPDPKQNDTTDGFRYYETSPFLLITTDGKGGLESKVLYLPDTTKLRTIKPYSFAAKNQATLTFDKGTLVQAKAVVDETIVPTAIVGALEKVAIAAIKGGNGGAEGIPSPFLFRIYSNGDGIWSLEGGQALESDNKTPIRIRFTPENKG